MKTARFSSISAAALGLLLSTACSTLADPPSPGGGGGPGDGDGDGDGDGTGPTPVPEPVLDGIWVACVNDKATDYAHYWVHGDTPEECAPGDAPCYYEYKPPFFKTCVGRDRPEGWTFTNDNDELQAMSLAQVQTWVDGIITHMDGFCANACQQGVEGYPVKESGPSNCSAQAWSSIGPVAWTGELGYEVGSIDTYDPADGFNCTMVEEGTFGDSDGSDLDWDPGTGQLSIPLDCDLNDTCADEFPGPVAEFLMNTAAMSVMPDHRRQADYEGTASSSTSLAIDMPGSGTGVDDTEALSGTAEYTVLEDCGGNQTCPFALLNLTAEGAGGATWEIEIDAIDDNGRVVTVRKSVQNVNIGLLQPTMGVLNTADGRVAFPAGTLRIGVALDLVNGPHENNDAGNGRYTKAVMVNADDAWGTYSHGTLTLNHTFALQSGTATLNIGLNPTGAPPVASHKLKRGRRCNGPSGYYFDLNKADSTDPNGDIAYQHWIVDGENVGESTTLPVRRKRYKIELEAVDSRGARSITEVHKMRVRSGPSCAPT